jgi:dipeptidyl aminopeptidase/acylaminoacyl peptidase
MPYKLSISIVLLLAAVSYGARAQQEADPVYREPPVGIVALVDAPPTPAVLPGPRGRRLLVLERPALPSIAELAAPELRLAGLRFSPLTRGPSRGAYYTAMRVVDLGDGEERGISIPGEGGKIRFPAWSPDGESLAFVLDNGERLDLWLAEPESGAAHRASASALNAVFGRPCEWYPAGDALACRVHDGERAPQGPAAPPVGPVVRESSGSSAPARTYQDLLSSPRDEQVFALYATSQVVRVGVGGVEQALGKPALVRRAEPSPDGRLLLVETLQRPFSHLVPWSRFPRRVAVWDAQGAEIQEIASLPLLEEVPIGFDATTPGPRGHDWRPGEPATLSWREALDGGDPRREAELRDELWSWEAPFEQEPRSLARTELRLLRVHWGSDFALLQTRRWRDRLARFWRVPAQGGLPETPLFEYSYEDRYSLPGTPVTVSDLAGSRVVAENATGRVFFSGAGASEEGDRPFLDLVDTRRARSKRLWQSAAPHYEAVATVLDVRSGRFLTRRETVDEPPNYFLRDSIAEHGRAVTDFAHPYPQLASVYKEILRYRRSDGTELQATLYLPPGKLPADGPFPMLMWAYPREFKNAAAAGQMRGSPHRFKAVSVRGPLPLLATGFAVLDGPTMPVVGEGEALPNDTFVEQLVASAEAAIDEVVRRGVAERDRIAIGGHSYGAFMTANLLAHSDLYRTGIARSGAYNRSLTPFGFQAEERTFWEAPEIYFQMSPFMHAHRVNEPILMLHGQADNNSGTFPLQSERFFNALKGHGVAARLVMLPHESHGYAARESVLHNLWEMNTWLERWLGSPEG